MLNRENMLKWADALESGQYEQHRGSWGQHTTGSDVVYPGEFCCLNVACMVLTGKDVGCLPKTAGGPSGGMQFLSDQGIPVMQHPFVAWNDFDKLTFPQIAAKIREIVAEEEEDVQS